MSKTIVVKDKYGNPYTLEFTRRSVELLERSGFKIRDIKDFPMTTLPRLFEGAFLAHHKNVKKETVDEIFAKLNNKDDLIGKLAEMYNEPIEALVAEPEDSEEGNAGWEASW